MVLANKSIDIYHVTNAVVIIFLLIINKAITSPVYKETAHWGHNMIGNISGGAITESPHCQENLFASFTAQPVDIPTLNDPAKMLYCQWTIKSPRPGLTIGISVVQKSLDYFVPNTFLIDIYDGPSTGNAKLSHWHGMHDYSLSFFEPMVSTGDTISINYKTIGGPLALHMKLIYYLCGGKIESDTQIESPSIIANSTYDVPNYLECTWVIVKPDRALYGYLHVNKVNVLYCDTISIATGGENLIVLERVSNNDTSNNSLSEIVADDKFSLERERLRNANYDLPIEVSQPSFGNESILLQNETTNSTEKMHHFNLCNNTVRGIAFFSSRAVLRFFMVLPESRYGFSITYVPLRIPTGAKKKKEIPWYRNYTPIAIYLPIGVILGMVIILVQSRTRRFPVIVVNQDSVNFQNSRPPAHSAAGCSRFCCRFSRSESKIKTCDLIAEKNSNSCEVIVSQPLTNAVTFDTLVESPTTSRVTLVEPPTTSGVTLVEPPTTSGVTLVEPPTTSGVTLVEPPTTSGVTLVEPPTTSGVTLVVNQTTDSVQQTQNEADRKQMSVSDSTVNLIGNEEGADIQTDRTNDKNAIKLNEKQSETIVSLQSVRACLPLTRLAGSSGKNVSFQTKVVE